MKNEFINFHLNCPFQKMWQELIFKWDKQNKTLGLDSRASQPGSQAFTVSEIRCKGDFFKYFKIYTRCPILRFSLLPEMIWVKSKNFLRESLLYIPVLIH